MISKKNKYQNLIKRRAVLACLMMFLLLVLTSANFFFYFAGEQDAKTVLVVNQDDEAESFPGSPSGPDEKAPGGPVSISEEFLHGHTEHTGLFLPGRLFTHLITDSEKIELVHFELLSPPPEC